MSKRQRIPEETVERIVAMYPTMSRREISAELGITDYAVDLIVYRLGLKHTEETLRRFEERRIDGQRAWAKTPEGRAGFAAMGQTRKRIVKIERLRMMGGQQQQTGIRLWIFPKKVRAAIWNLRNRYGYRHTINSYTLYYDAQTRRCKNEARFTAKYGLQFLPEETEEEEPEEETEEEQEAADSPRNEQEYDDTL